MEYNEREFQKLANKQALGIWIAINAILSIAYAIEVLKDQKTMDFYVIFLILAWLPVLIGVIVLFVRGMHTKIFREIIAIGYGIFFAFVLVTADTAITFSVTSFGTEELLFGGVHTEKKVVFRWA